MIQNMGKSSLKSTRVMTEAELGDIGCRGWTLLAIIQEKTFVPTETMAPCRGGSPNGPTCLHGYSGPCPLRISTTEPMEFTVTKYVMGRDEETVIGEMSQEIENLQKDLKRKQEHVDYVNGNEVVLKTAIADLEREVENLQRGDKNSREHIGKQDDRIVQHIKTITKMEADLGKVRAHIGTAEFDKCLKKDS